MNRLMIGCAALALMGAGAAFAQNTQSGDTQSGSSGMAPPAPTSSQPGPAPTTDTTTPTPSTSGMAPSAGEAAPAPATPMNAPAPAAGSPTIVGDMSQANPPPAAGAYPPCTHKGQDRCTTMAKAHRKAATTPGM